MMTPHQFSACKSVLTAILPFSHPADACVSHFFRTHPKLGQHDRHVIAETVFAILRHLQALMARCVNVEATALLIIWLATHYNLREFAHLLTADELAFAKAAKAASPIALTLAQQAELPEWVIAQLHQHAWQDVDILALGQAMQQPAPLDLRVNTLKIKREAMRDELIKHGIETTLTPYSPFGLRLTTKPALQRLACFKDGYIEVQDEGSQLVGLLLNPRRGEMIADFCAGAGGKTLLLGALMQSTGRIYAFDIHDKRLHNLKDRLKRSGLSNVYPQLISSEHDSRLKRLAGKLDAVLVDAPCSGLGTLRRNPDLRFRCTPDSVRELQNKQVAILQNAANLLKPGGRLLYATCSILNDENQYVVEQFLNANPVFKLLPVGPILDKLKIPLLIDTPYLQLLPSVHYSDGFFAAVLQRGLSTL